MAVAQYNDRLLKILAMLTGFDIIAQFEDPTTEARVSFDKS